MIDFVCHGRMINRSKFHRAILFKFQLIDHSETCCFFSTNLDLNETTTTTMPFSFSHFVKKKKTCLYRCTIKYLITIIVISFHDRKPINIGKISFQSISYRRERKSEIFSFFISLTIDTKEESINKSEEKR